MISFVFLWLRKKSFEDPYYIDHIVSSIEEHTTHACDFVCITDQVRSPTEWNNGVRAFPLRKKFSKHQHCKLEAFRPDLELCERAVLTDLDNFVIDDLDELLAYEGTFGARRTFLPEKRPQPQLSWAQFHTPSCYPIWERAKDMTDEQVNDFAPTGQGRGDQLFVYKVLGEYDRLDDLYPGALESWKFGWDDRAKVLFAHGKPKPHQLEWTPWWPWEKLSEDVKRKRTK
jgi:hypothetical protein